MDGQTRVLGVANPADVDIETIRDHLRAYKSPMLAELDTTYPAIVASGVSVAFAFAVYTHESACGTKGTAVQTRSMGNTRQAYKVVGGKEDRTQPIYFGAVPLLESRTETDPSGRAKPGNYPVLVGGRSGMFPIFRNCTDGAKAFVGRLMSPDWVYYGKGLATIAAIIPVYAPSNDGNNVAVYVASVVATMAQLYAKGRAKMGHVPKPPINVRIIPVGNGPAEKRLGVGVEWSNVKRSPLFSVVHAMIGTLKGTDGYFRQPTVAGLTDFGIGAANLRGGFAEIMQWCDYRGNYVPWASGVVTGAQYGDGKRAIDKWGIGAVNRNGVAFELEDGGSTTSVIAAPTWASLCWALAWFHAEELGQTADTFDWNCHHREFTGGNGRNGIKNCPEAHVYDFTDEYQEVVKSIMRYYQTDTKYPGPAKINGMYIPVPIGADGFTQSPIQLPPAPNDTFIPCGPYMAKDGSPILIGGLFRQRWEANPDRMVDWGWPVTNELRETLQDGKEYTVQYFERERFQLNSATDVGFGLIGLENAITKGYR